MARSRPRRGARIALLGLLKASWGPLLASCAAPPAPVPQPGVVAPLPQQYTCEQQRRLAADYEALPAGSMARTAIDDYGAERRALRAVHGLLEPTPCPQVAAP